MVLTLNIITISRRETVRGNKGVKSLVKNQPNRVA